MNKPTVYKIIYLFTLTLLISCGSKMKGTWKCTGGMVDDLEFLNGEQVIVGLFGAKATNTYVLNQDTLNIKTDKADLVFKVVGEELKGEKYFAFMEVGNCKK
ncbi:MAG: hypothetical protein KA146_06980 [Leptospiraceae bacterium]|nr:hypothetical protein [Leptospiraceae bacterium]